MTSSFFPIISILGLSIIVQAAAAIMAIRLVGITGRRAAWCLIAAALVLMAVRRIVPLYRLITGDISHPPDVVNEVIGLALSAAMAIGISLIAPLFHERKRAEENIKRAEEEWLTTFNSTSDLFFLIDADYRITKTNKAASNFLKLPTEQIVGRHCYELMHGTTYPPPACPLLKLQQSMRHEEAELYLEAQEIWVQVTVDPVLDEKGKLLRVVHIVRDITERKRVEEALRRSEEQHRTILETAMDGFWLVDAQGRLLEVNESYCRMSGYSAQELLAMRIPDLEAAETADDTAARIQKIMAQGEDRFESRHCRKDRSCYDIEISVQSRPADGGQMVVFLRDITERKRSEKQLARLNEELEQRVRDRTALLQRKTEELEQANERLKEVDRLKSTFISSMSHELRTPLNAVIGFSSIMLDEWLGPVNDEQKQNLASILGSGKHLLNMITDVLDVTQIEAGTVIPVIEEFDLYDLLTEAENQVSAAMREKGLELRSALLRQRMRTDRRRLLQCALNILSNAAKFTDKGSVTLEARIVTFSGETQNEEMVEIAVTDTGIGINEEDQSRIFQPFHRIVTPQRAIVPGTGLGLFLTRKITTEILKGDLIVSSEYGKGSRFSLKIPVRLP